MDDMFNGQQETNLKQAEPPEQGQPFEMPSEAAAMTIRTIAGEERPIDERNYVAPPSARNVTPFPKPVETFTTSPETDQLFAAFVDAQAEFGEVERILTAHVASKREGARSFTYDYAPLSEVLRAVRPVLNKHGIGLLQPPVARATSVVVTTLLVHKSGQWFRNDCGLVIGPHMDPQAFGSIVTYIRRYALQSTTGIAPADGEDNDGQRAMPPTSAAYAGTTGPCTNGNGQAKAAAPGKDLMPTRASASAPRGDLNITVADLQAAANTLPPKPAAAPVLLVVTLEPRKKTGTNTPFWILNLSDKRRLVTFNRELAERAGGWVVGQRAVVVDKTHIESHGGVDWTFVDAMSVAPEGGRHV